MDDIGAIWLGQVDVPVGAKLEKRQSQREGSRVAEGLGQTPVRARLCLSCHDKEQLRPASLPHSRKWPACPPPHQTLHLHEFIVCPWMWVLLSPHFTEEKTEVLPGNVSKAEF